MNEEIEKEIEKIIEQEIREFGKVRTEIYVSLESIALNNIERKNFSSHRVYNTKFRA